MVNQDLVYTPIEKIPSIVRCARTAFDTGRIRSLDYRRKQLRQLAALIDENREALNAALLADLRKCPNEAQMCEYMTVKNDIADALLNLEKWAAPQAVAKTPAQMFNRMQIRKDPLGVVLIIGAWNYPFALTIGPLVGAIAAGNAAIIKPSEISANIARVIGDLMPKYLDSDAYIVVNGGKDETTALLQERFDHIFYTGSGVVGRIVMAAAAKHLTPVTLELGGKSPTFVDANVDLGAAARSIVWGRFLNAGQTCIAPDYILTYASVRDKLVRELKKAITEMFGEDPQRSPAYCRIVNQNHFNRVRQLIPSAGVVIGGETDEADLYIAPTVIVDVNPEQPIMKEEIFGPLLPIMVVDSPDQAIRFINSRDKPLALYCFSGTSSVIERFATETSSGGFVGNDVVTHFATPALPFGGVGPSGMGRYHGKFSFDTFTHDKAYITGPTFVEKILALRYPPFPEFSMTMINLLVAKKVPSPLKIWLSKPATRRSIMYLVLAAAMAACVYRIETATPGFWSGLLVFFGIKK
ncbi:hypothetical protein H696_03769 [Fonticula alba]|uniref:Aldehyde dehydrogenase n=1 Tax=Fonticula alba TaxID=691883 RepID=A0A058Z731_FONAL|nr:hypothetical protein H696_03769 [Fonticula alba]KCV69337.1 hypothetical protein H696_03769 [Fonticula alba]|eukprot:XP_009495902.1 hypothetical protein H696_03769 [Fonticula alba]